MKPVVLILAGLPLFPATRWVGAGTPEGYDAHYAASDAGLQSAMDAAAYGDTIVIQEGTIADVSTVFPYKSGNGWITIKCETMPPLGPGTRVNPTTNLPLCKLVANSSGTAVFDVAEESYSVTADPATDRINWTASNLAEGTPVVVGTNARYGLLACDALNSPIATDCTADRVDYFWHRPGTMNIADGTPLYLYGDPRTTIGGFTYSRYYYVVNSAVGRLRLAETSGGAPIDITSSSQQSAVQFGRMAHPLKMYQIYYARNTTANDFQLSETAGGSIIDITTAGSTIIAGIANQRIRGWKLQGLEISKADGGSAALNLVQLGSAPRHDAQMAQDFILDRMYIHGLPWQTGVLHVENNYLSAMGESVMFGGSAISGLNMQARNVVFRRNWFDRPFEWFKGVVLSRTSATLLTAVVHGATSTQCMAASALSPGLQCVAFRPGNSTARSITNDSTVAVDTGKTPTGPWGFGVKDDCTFEFRYVGTAGDYVKTGDITLVQQAGPSLDWTGIVNRIEGGTTTSGSISSTISTSRNDMRNNFETKAGELMLFEGNVFSGGWYTGGNDGHIVLNVQPSGGSAGGSVSWWARASEHVIQNNIFRDGVSSYAQAGQSSAGGFPEASGFRDGTKNVFRNNLNYRIGSYYWGKSTSHHSSNRPIYITEVDHVIIDHNTFDDASNNTVITAGGSPFRYQSFTNNIFVPVSGSTTFPHLASLNGAGNGWVSVMITGGKCVTDTCAWLNNAVVNPSGSSQSTQYPTNGTTRSFLVGANQSVTSLGFTNYASRNYRITAGDYAAGRVNSGTDGQALGADQDEIEALTGTLGADVETGIPEFARRTNLILTPGTTTATLAYKPEASGSCAIKVWDNSAYSGATVVDMDDSGALVSGGRRSNTLTGLTTGTNYYGKLICGTSGSDGIAILRFRTR